MNNGTFTQSLTNKWITYLKDIILPHLKHFNLPWRTTTYLTLHTS